ncbi:hypothetical protein IWX90DRAFT_237393 [Phyllosticta citrichinensis]|uniref:Uncharacterized protein n=1 Tax=Phyllosticta citrichinensis TaxID=1130410 RepID=A0ABR1XQ60_9PEZI
MEPDVRGLSCKCLARAGRGLGMRRAHDYARVVVHDVCCMVFRRYFLALALRRANLLTQIQRVNTELVSNTPLRLVATPSSSHSLAQCAVCLYCLLLRLLDEHSGGMIVRDNAHQLVIIVLVQGIPALILFGLRVLVRTTRASWGSDDWAMVAAVVRLQHSRMEERQLILQGPFAVQTMGVILAARFGIGVLDEHLNPHEAPDALKEWHCSALWLLCVD